MFRALLTGYLLFQSVVKGALSFDGTENSVVYDNSDNINHRSFAAEWPKMPEEATTKPLVFSSNPIRDTFKQRKKEKVQNDKAYSLVDMDGTILYTGKDLSSVYRWGNANIATTGRNPCHLMVRDIDRYMSWMDFRADLSNRAGHEHTRWGTRQSVEEELRRACQPARRMGP